MKTNMSNVMYTNEEADLVMTAKMTYIDFNALNSLATLNTLNVLNTLIVLKADRLPPEPPTAVITNSTTDIETTPPSSQFILSNMYFRGPTATIFEAISTIKIQVNSEPAYSKLSIVS